MADLTFTNLNAALPGSPFKYNTQGGYYYMEIDALLGYPDDLNLEEEKVSDMMVKLLEACNAAQTAYNADPANTKDIRSFLAPTASAPTKDADGMYRSTFTYTTSIRRPLVTDVIDAVEV